MRANRDPEKVQVGHWYSMCCLLDLCSIETEDELEDVRRYLQEAKEDPREDTGMVTYATLAEAVSDFVSQGENLDDRPDLKRKLMSGVV